MTRYFNKTTAYVMLAACALSFTSVQAQVQEHAAHEHAEHVKMQLKLDHNNQRWATDAPLRKGMERIQAAVNQAQLMATNIKLDGTQAAELVTANDDAIAYIFQNCNLEPRADANLHILLSQLIAANSAMKTDANAVASLAQMQAALDAYPKYFNHPEWQAKDHNH